MTLALALCTFVLTQIAGIRAAGIGGYLKHLTGGSPWWLWLIMIPVEILGLFTKPFALTVRLFANMLAGHIVLFFLLGLIFILGHAVVAVVAVPFGIFIYLLELFVAFLQAYIFTMLSALFIGMGVAMGHHDEHPHEEHGKAHEPATARPRPRDDSGERAGMRFRSYPAAGSGPPEVVQKGIHDPPTSGSRRRK